MLTRTRHREHHQRRERETEAHPEQEHRWQDMDEVVGLDRHPGEEHEPHADQDEARQEHRTGAEAGDERAGERE